jgi:hypothetical protein
MKKFFTHALVLSLSLTLGYGFALAGKDLRGNGFPNGKHYNLNIIGVPQDKEVPTMTGSHRHTIFVPLNSGDDVGRKVKIKYVVNPDENEFRVVDGNATDDNVAVIQVPFEYCDLESNDSCTELLSFMVYARGLGKPGQDTGAVVTAECEYELSVVDPLGTEGLTCEDTLLLGEFEINRPRKKPRTVDITDIFRATGCLDFNVEGEEGYGECSSGDLEFSNIWIFNIPYLDEYMWDYDNNGLKLMQVRFYETTSGYIGWVE